MTHRWLVSSGGRRGALVRILQGLPAPERGWVLVTDASRLSAAGLLADEFETVPPIAEDGFLPTMIDLCRINQIASIVPTIDTELVAYAERKDAFAAVGTDVLVSSPDIVRLSMDKWELHKWLRGAGFPSVDTYERRGFVPGLLSGPVVAKPRAGSSSVGVLIAEDASRLSLDALPDDYIIQSRASGYELTIDFAVGRDGALLGAVPRRRLEVRAGEVSKAITVRTAWLDEFVRDFAAALPGAYGVLNVQIFVDPDTRSLTVIELNARVGGGYPLSFQAGADFFSPLARNVGAGGDHWDEGVVMVRYDDAVFFRSTEFGLA